MTADIVHAELSDIARRYGMAPADLERLVLAQFVSMHRLWHAAPPLWAAPLPAPPGGLH